jgi:hypothetical protein
MDAAAGRLSFIGRVPSAEFRLRHIAIAPGFERRCDEAEWLDTILFVERGAVELVCANGARWRFVSGDVFCLCRVPPRLLRGAGVVPVVLSAVSRRRSPDR